MRIALPGGKSVAARPGKYRVSPPPDLNDVAEARYLLEYDFPHLVVNPLAMPKADGVEQLEAIRQAENWRAANPGVGGSIGGCLEAYQLTPERRYQLVPSLSYIDEPTWSQLSLAAKSKSYIPCVPAVVVELTSREDNMADLQAKVAQYVDAGTREAVVVDTRQSCVWIHNQGQRPYFDALAVIEFDAWPGFSLDCEAIRDARTREGLP